MDTGIVEQRSRACFGEELRSRQRYFGNSGTNYTLTSMVEMLPTTLCWLSSTARDVTPSKSSSSRASRSGRSPLEDVS